MELPLKIFVCCHNKYDILPPFGVPVQGGRAINPPLEGAKGDVGRLGSISEKNREYCELTVQYYAWKNEDCKSLGFCHYRRFFCFDESVKQPYLAFDALTEESIRRFFKSGEEIAGLAEKYDIITVRAEKTRLSVRDYYAASAHHYAEDIELFTDILKRKYPHMQAACEKYLDGSRQYFCNMFIMSKQLFGEYCEMLFDILGEFDEKKQLHGSFLSDRTDGYLGERFFGIFMTCAYEKGLRIKELARIDTHCTLKKRILYRLFPPESKRRFFLQSLAKK